MGLSDYVIVTLTWLWSHWTLVVRDQIVGGIASGKLDPNNN